MRVGNKQAGLGLSL